DLRGYTDLSERVGATEVALMLNAFYDACSAAVWERDGIVNKFIGDAVLAIFNFPIMRDDHVRQAVLAGVEIQRLCLGDRGLLARDAEGRDMPIGVGIGIHTGHATIGEVGTAYKDFTIIGPAVNTASRIQASAQRGDILVTDDVYGQVADLFPAAEARVFHLKGIEHPVNAYRLQSLRRLAVPAATRACPYGITQNAPHFRSCPPAFTCAIVSARHAQAVQAGCLAFLLDWYNGHDLAHLASLRAARQ